MTPRRWRVLGTISLVTALAALGAGIAYAVTTFRGTGTGFASTATVSVGLTTSAHRTCTYRNLEPGDLPGSPPATCTFSVAYTGTVPAHMALGVLVETKAGAGRGRLPLYDPATGSGLFMTIHDNQSPSVAYELPRSATTCPANAPPGSTCDQLNYLLVSLGTFTSSSHPVVFTVTPHFTTAAGNPFQGGTANVLLTVHVVQAAANPLPKACTAGRSCPPIGSFSWS